MNMDCVYQSNILCCFKFLDFKNCASRRVLLQDFFQPNIDVSKKHERLFLKKNHIGIIILTGASYYVTIQTFSCIFLKVGEWIKNKLEQTSYR